MDICRICNNSESNVSHTAREMYLGFRDEFAYLECSRCGCLQIGEIPVDLSKYYPRDYYSFVEPLWSEGTSWRDRYQRARLKFKYFFFERVRLGKLMGAIKGKEFQFPIDPAWFRRSGLERTARILDVGCGAGKLLDELATVGFTNLVGVDPYIGKDTELGNGVKIYNKNIEDVNDLFDLIMFNHSFEHTPSPRQVLKECRRLLNPGKYLLIRMPTVSSFAWREYGTNWVQLDAPRHLYLHSLKSMDLLSKDASFVVTDVLFESTSFQFCGSEQYKKDIPLMAENSFLVNPDESIFQKRDMKNYEKMASRLNRKKDGDQTCFYLKKT